MQTEQFERLEAVLASRYRLEGTVGAGGMATVYRAEDLRHGRKVAVKVLRPDLTAVLGVERFLQEIRITAGLDHPHILTLIDSGASDGFVWYVLPYVRGESLRQKLEREGQLPVEEALHIARQVGSALDYAHRLGLIHRDIKPGNILLFEGEATLVDFGIALAVKEAGGQRLTETGIWLGTPQYMSPEQATGDSELDARADVYSLGAVLYEMLTGEAPHTGPSVQAVIAKLISEEPTNVRVLRPKTPPNVEAAVMKAVATHRADRFSDVRKFVAALEHGAPAEKPPVRYRAAAAIGGLLAVATLLVVLFASPSTPRVTGHTQLSSTRVLLPPYLSPMPLVTDGSRIYFGEFVNLFFELRQVAHSGGDALPLAPLGERGTTGVRGITPDRSHLVLAEFGGYPLPLESRLWLWPVAGGPPRRLGELIGHAVEWSPDGQSLVYMYGDDIYIARPDGTEPRKLLAAPGRPYWPAFSPDGRRLRFTALDWKTHLWGLWEVSADGSDLRPLLPGWNDPPNHCCGSWTPDGKYYVFQATHGDQTHIWALRERGGLFPWRQREPIQLTTGPMNFLRPLIGPDGERLFAIGWQLRGELVQYDTQSRRFVPHPTGLSAEWVAYARDGEWMVYVTYPEAHLWRSRYDGTDRLQLTFSPMRARRPQWSPDGRTIAFEGQVGDQHWKIYLVSSDGGAPRPLTAGDRLEWSPTWSADGRYLAFSLAGDQGIRIFDFESGEDSHLQGSNEVRYPRWSPDGQTLAAHSLDRRALLLFDFATGRWDELARADFISDHYWSHDGELLHFHTDAPFTEFYRVRLGDGHLQHLGSLRDSRFVFGIGGLWMGVTPDGSPLHLRDQSIHHIYALDWER